MSDQKNKENKVYPTTEEDLSLEDSLNASHASNLSSSCNSEGLDSSSESEVLKKKKRTTSPNPSSFMVAASPPKFINFETLMQAANGVKNMSLAHEIAVDSEFQLQKHQPKEHSIEKQVKEVMHRAFWDSLSDQINADPPHFSHALILLQEIKENLVSLLLPQHQRIRSQIAEVIDLDLIRQKIDNEAFDFNYYAGFVISVMAQLCAPIRDEKISALKEIKEVVPLYKEIFGLVDLMKMDMANFTISQMRPYLQQQSVEYEKKKFQEFLEMQKENNIDGVEVTKAWLQRAFDQLTKQQSAFPVTPLNILNEAYMELFQWDRTKILPETLVMDVGRYSDLKSQTDHICLVSAILLVTYNTIGAPISGITQFKHEIKDKISIILKDLHDSEIAEKVPNVLQQILTDVGACLEKHGYSRLRDDQQDLIKGQVTDVINPQHSVHQLVRSRMFGFILQSASSMHHSPMKLPAGLSAFEAEISQVCGQFIRLISHNRSVFGVWYSNIIGELLKQNKHESDYEPEQANNPPILGLGDTGKH